MKTEIPQNVKYFIGALFSDSALLNKAQKHCEARIGDIDLKSEAFPFDLTDYYNQEMGKKG